MSSTQVEARTSIDLVFVEIGHKRYAIPTQWVEEVLPVVEPTPMPSWPEFALGVINVHGELLPLIDIAPLLDRPPCTIRTSTLIVLVAAFERRWGLLVDAVEGVHSGIVTSNDTKGVVMGVTVEKTGAVVVVLNALGLLQPLRAIGQELASAGRV